MEGISKEQRKVVKWRYERLVEAGFEDISAWIIARSQADLHQACGLAGKCDPHLAVKILT